MAAINPTSGVLTDQLTRALGDAVIRVWSICQMMCKIISSRRQWRLVASRSDRS